MSVLVRLVRPAEQRVSGEFGNSTPPPPGGIAGAAGVSVTENTALSIPAVYSCVGLLADQVSTLPFAAVRRDGNIRQPLAVQPRVLEEPWHEITKQDWLSQGMVSAPLRGDYFALVAERDRLAYPTQLFPLHPDQVSVRRNRVTRDLEYRVDGAPYRSEDIFHISGLKVPGGLRGMSVLANARQGLALTIAAETYGASFFANSALASVVIRAKEDLDEDEILALAKQWKSLHQGPAKAHMPAVLTGDADITQISLSPEDAQFLQTRKFQRSEIAMLFRIPPHMIGDVDRTTSWGSGIEQQAIGFVTFTLRPWLVRFESAFNRILPPDIQAKFNVAGLLRGDTLARYQAYTLGRNGGWLNIDDVRALEDMAPLPDGIGQSYTQPLNMGVLGPNGVIVPAVPDPAPAPPLGTTGE